MGSLNQREPMIFTRLAGLSYLRLATRSRRPGASITEVRVSALAVSLSGVGIAFPNTRTLSGCATANPSGHIGRPLQPGNLGNTFA